MKSLLFRSTIPLVDQVNSMAFLCVPVRSYGFLIRSRFIMMLSKTHWSLLSGNLHNFEWRWNNYYHAVTREILSADTTLIYITSTPMQIAAIVPARRRDGLLVNVKPPSSSGSSSPSSGRVSSSPGDGSNSIPQVVVSRLSSSA